MPISVKSLSEWEEEKIDGMLSVLIPAYNEAEVIELTVRSLYEELVSAKILHEILVIYDVSTDETESVLRKLQSEIPTLRCEKNRPPKGFGFAIRYGLTIFRGDAVCLFMADCSDSPKDLVSFYQKMQEGYDCIFGSRFIKKGYTYDYPFLKLLLNRAGNLFIRILFWNKYNDTTSSFKLYRRYVISRLQPFLSSHFNLTVELPLKAIVRGYKYAVLPNSWHNRKKGTSKFIIREIASRYLFTILSCFIEKIFSCGDCKNIDSQKHEKVVWHR